MLADASVLRNFAILGWIDPLVALAGGTVYVAHGVMGIADDEPGEIEGIRNSFEEESLRHPGSPAASAATAAFVGLDALLRRRSHDISVLTHYRGARRCRSTSRPRGESLAPAAGSEGETPRRRRGGFHRYRTSRGLGFASDDDDARLAYLALGGPHHAWTLDLIENAVGGGLLGEVSARGAYEKLRRRYRFWGVPWH